MPPPTTIYIGRMLEEKKHNPQDVALTQRGYTDYPAGAISRNGANRDNSIFTDSSTPSTAKSISSPKQIYHFDKTHRRTITLFI
mmetsp:Transcript_27776/g.42031  ORF Transcript_27776/g.42031 Transcript_27776/m.42031 type:complete len:84 (+) Transcript_27776:118-369(+)